MIERTIVEGPETRIHETHENHYVPVDTDRHQNAYAWATARLVRHSPGAYEQVERLDSLIKQKLNATPERA